MIYLRDTALMTFVCNECTSIKNFKGQRYCSEGNSLAIKPDVRPEFNPQNSHGEAWWLGQPVIPALQREKQEDRWILLVKLAYLAYLEAPGQ